MYRAVDSLRSESYDVIYYSCIGKVLADLAATKDDEATDVKVSVRNFILLRGYALLKKRRLAIYL